MNHQDIKKFITRAIGVEFYGGMVSWGNLPIVINILSHGYELVLLVKVFE